MTTLRRRLDNASLRWQARLDSEWSDRVLPWAFAAGLFAILVALALARARSLDGGTDLGLYTQASYLVVEDGDPIVTVREGSHVLAQQAAFLFYPVAWLTRLFPTIVTLLVVQALALAIGVIPLWRLARRRANLRPGASLALVWAYAVYPALHTVNLSDFHPETLAVPALLFAAYFGLGERWILFGIACGFAMAARADLGLAVAGLGGLLFVEGKRRPGLITFGAGLAYVVLAVVVVQPGYGAGSYAHVDSFASYGDTPLSVLSGMLSNPFEVLGDLTAEANFAAVVFLLAPVFFLPVLAPRYLLPVVPLEALYLVADVPEEATFGQQTVAMTAFVFIAATFAIARIGREGVERVLVDRRVVGALVLVSTVFFVLDAPSSPYRQPWDWGGRDEIDSARLDAVDLVGDSDSVRASPALVPLLAERERIYVLDPQQRPHVRNAIDVPADQQSDEADTADRRVDMIILDATVTAWSETERRVFREGLERQGYERVMAADGIEVFSDGRAALDLAT